MSLICPASCLTGFPPQQYFDCVDVLRKCGSCDFILSRCDWQPADITAPSLWAIAQNTGEIQLSPPGKFTIGEPTFDTVELDGCGRETPGELSWLITYETYQTKEDLSDCDYWKEIFDKAPIWRIMWRDCEGNFQLNEEYTNALRDGATTVLGATPGFAFSIVTPPHEIEGDGKYCKWTMQYKIITNSVLCKTLLPGVNAAI